MLNMLSGGMQPRQSVPEQSMMQPQPMLYPGQQQYNRPPARWQSGPRQYNPNFNGSQRRNGGWYNGHGNGLTNNANTNNSDSVDLDEQMMQAVLLASMEESGAADGNDGDAIACAAAPRPTPQAAKSSLSGV